MYVFSVVSSVLQATYLSALARLSSDPFAALELLLKTFTQQRHGRMHQQAVAQPYGQRSTAQGQQQQQQQVATDAAQRQLRNRILRRDSNASDGDVSRGGHAMCVAGEVF